MTARLVTVQDDWTEGVGQPAPFGVSVNKISGVGPLSGRHTDCTTLTPWRTEDDPEWSFVHPRYLTTPGLYRYLARREQHSLIFRRTQHVQGYRRFDRRVVNVGIDVRRIERVIGRPVARVRLKTVDSPRDLGARRARTRDGRGAGIRRRRRSLPSSAIAMPSILVPPKSMPMRMRL